MASVFYLNASGGSRYTIGRYCDGVASPPQPVIGTANDGGAGGVAWPSAFRVNGAKTRVYASRYVSGRWSDLSLWEAPDEKNFALAGQAVTALPSEPHGIGPAAFAFAPGRTRPWVSLFTVRNTQAGFTIGAADSISGDAGDWQRAGTALSVSESWEAYGICPSYLFFDDVSSKWTLVYHAYETANLAHAAMATAGSPLGPFVEKTKIASPTNSRFAFVGAQGAGFATAAQAPLLGQPYVLRQALPGAMEVIVPVRYQDGVVYFDRPLIGNYPSGEMAHVAASKIDPSFVERLPDGCWRGLWTGYGQYPGVLSEYTFEVRAASLAGPWSFADAGMAFQPWTSFGILSTENPAPLVPVTTH